MDSQEGIDKDKIKYILSLNLLYGLVTGSLLKIVKKFSLQTNYSKITIESIKFATEIICLIIFHEILKIFTDY